MQMTIKMSALLAMLLSVSHPAFAYVGPSLGLGTVGAVLAFVFSLFLAVVAMFWYPLKRLLGFGKGSKAKAQSSEKNESD